MERLQCRVLRTSSGALASDVTGGRLPTVGMVVPNMCNSGHDCSLATVGAWLKKWLAVIRAGSDWTSGRLAIVATFEENDGGVPNNALTIILDPRVSPVLLTKFCEQPVSKGVSGGIWGMPTHLV